MSVVDWRCVRVTAARLAGIVARSAKIVGMRRQSMVVAE